MRVLVLGGSGMLGHKMFQVLSEDFETFATFRNFNNLLIYKPNQIIDNVDAMSFVTVACALAKVKPDVVINCIGVIKQIPEANDPLISISVNSLFPHSLANLCQTKGTRMIHVSTDCVFSGRDGNYVESDVSDAEDLYGRTKFLGEVNRPGCLTIRTSVFGRSFNKKAGLLEWFLGNRGSRVHGYTNAIYTGFSTQALAQIVRDLIINYPFLSGLYHISSDPISKHDLLVMIRDAMKLDIEIEPKEDFYCDRSLDSYRFRIETGYLIPTWDEVIAGLVEDDTPYDICW